MYLDPDFVHETNVSISGKLHMYVCMYVRPSTSNVTGFHVRRMYICDLPFFGREITTYILIYICILRALLCLCFLCFWAKKEIYQVLEV